MGKEADKIVLWRKLTRGLRKLYNNKDAYKDLNQTNEPDSIVEKSENMQKPTRFAMFYRSPVGKLAKGVVRVLQTVLLRPMCPGHACQSGDQRSPQKQNIHQQILKFHL